MVGARVMRLWQEAAVDAPLSSLERLFGVEFGPWGAGIVGTSTERLAGSGDLTVGGWGPVLDGALGRSVRAVLPPDRSLRTIDLRVDVLPRPGRGARADDGTGVVEVRAAALARDERSGVSRGEVLVDGDRVGVATGHFAIVPEDESATVNGATAEVPMVEGGVAGLFGWAEIGDHPAGIDVEVRPSRAAANHYGIMHGGGQVLLVDAMLEETLLRARPGCDLLDLTVEYHRPVPVDGSVCRVSGRITRAGGLVQQVETRIEGPDGALLVVGRGVYVAPSR